MHPGQVPVEHDGVVLGDRQVLLGGVGVVHHVDDHRRPAQTALHRLGQHDLVLHHQHPPRPALHLDVRLLKGRPPRYFAATPVTPLTGVRVPTLILLRPGSFTTPGPVVAPSSPPTTTPGTADGRARLDLGQIGCARHGLHGHGRLRSAAAGRSGFTAGRSGFAGGRSGFTAGRSGFTAGRSGFTGGRVGESASAQPHHHRDSGDDAELDVAGQLHGELPGCRHPGLR